MKHIISFCCLCAMAIAFVSQSMSAINASEPWQGRIDELVKPLVDQKKIVGAVVGMLTPDGGCEFSCYGKTKADGLAPTPETLFEIGSVSKTFTCLLLAQMVEKGELKLDDPARQFLPKEWMLPKRGDREITLMDLATHSSGLPENPPNLIRAVIKDASINLDPFAHFDHKQLAESLAEVKLKDVERPPVAYSNLGMGLLGEALVIKTGKSYGELIRTQIAEPLKMQDTVVIPSEAQDKRTATGHGKKGKELPCWTFASMAGAGAIRSTAADMLTYLAAQSGRTSTPLAAAMATTQERQQPAFVIMSVGLGWFMRDYDGRRVWWHNGGTGGFTSFVAFCRDPTVGVVVLCNTGPDGLEDGQVIDKVGDKLIRQLVKSENIATE